MPNYRDSPDYKPVPAPLPSPSEPEPFLTTLDGMIESTEEFILDDTSGDEPKAVLDQLVRNNKAGVADRLKDLLALEHVRKLYTDAFQSEED